MKSFLHRIRTTSWASALLLSARGAYVLRPNYHGSPGYGLKWAESILGRLNELEVEDINGGVDYLIDRGLADPDKLAVMGWSQGGTLTAAVTVATNRYKAAFAGDGPIDWIDYWGKSDIGGSFCGNYFGGNPFNSMTSQRKASSFYQMDKVTTPTHYCHQGADPGAARRDRVNRWWSSDLLLGGSPRNETSQVRCAWSNKSPATNATTASNQTDGFTVPSMVEA